MYLDGLSVTVHGGVEKSHGYVEMNHGDTYSLSLMNGNNRRYDAEIVIDGKSIGNFRLDSYSTVCIERPINNDGKFTFYKSNSEEAKLAKLSNISKNDLGLISVIFRPERIQEVKTTTQSLLSCAEIIGYNCFSGGTGLSVKSDQSFVEVGDLVYDLNQVRTINLRLVSKNNTFEVRELVGAMCTPIPVPV